MRTNIDVAEERKGLDISVLMHCIVRHIHVPLRNSLSLDATEMNGLLVGIILDKFDDGEAVYGSEMVICRASNGASGRKAVIEFHTRTRLLRALTCEYVDGRRLRNFSGTLENLLTTLVDGRDLDDDVAVAHTDMTNVGLELIAWQDHPDEADVVPKSGND